MSGTGDRAAEVFCEGLAHLVGLLPGGWIQRTGGGVAMVSGLPLPALNGVWILSETEPEVVRTLLDRVGSAGVAFVLQTRPGGHTAELARIAAARGMARDDDAPLMVLRRSRPWTAVAPVDGLTVRVLAPAEAELHRLVFRNGYPAPADLVEGLVPDAVVADPGVRAYLGEIGARPVSTAMVLTEAAGVAIFGVATEPDARGRGHAGAVMTRLLADAFADGAPLACLQPTPRARPFYERLGFHLVEPWAGWLGPA